MNKIFSEQLKKIKKDTLRLKKFSKNIKENQNYCIETENIFFDYSRNIIDEKSVENLLKLAYLIDIKKN